MYKALSAIVFLALLPSCSSPCRDYCEVFIDRTSECGLGGPSAGEDDVDDCGDEVSEALTDETCDTASHRIEGISCGEFTTLVCAQPSSRSLYKCPPG